MDTSLDTAPQAPGPTEDVANLRDLLNTQGAPKCSRQEESSTSEADLPYERTDNQNVDNGSASGKDDVDKTS